MADIILSILQGGIVKFKKRKEIFPSQVLVYRKLIVPFISNPVVYPLQGHKWKKISEQEIEKKHLLVVFSF